MRAVNVGDMVRVGDRWTEVKGFQIVDSRKCAVLAGAVGQLTVPVSRVSWDEKKYRFTLQPKDNTEDKAM
jgi:hypothetical protein